jgi:hypothetical protein
LLSRKIREREVFQEMTVRHEKFQCIPEDRWNQCIDPVEKANEEEEMAL